MTQLIWRPCYCSRDDVMRALDVKHAARNGDQIDRQIVQSAEGIDDLCNRQFFPEDKTCYFDYPNYSAAYPWRLWLNADELAVSPATLFKTGAITIPSTAYFCEPVNEGPPFTYIELDRSQSYSFGNSSTPQHDIALTGTYGYWYKTQSAAAQLTAALTDTTGTTVSVSNGAYTGIGDLLVVDSERMLIQDKQAADTTIAFSGLATASAADNEVAVPDTTQFTVGEVLRADSERLLIVDVLSSTLMIVKRAWDGTALAAHTSGTLWALRKLSVVRGATGSTAATHANSTAVSKCVVPGLVRALSVADSVVGLTQEPSAYSAGSPGGRTGGQQQEPSPGDGLSYLCSRVSTAYGRNARLRVV